FYCGGRVCRSDAVQQVIGLKPNADEDDRFVTVGQIQRGPYDRLLPVRRKR
ncbi:hypothetical protein ABG768_000082, partial [Culter alburnus]